MSSASTAGGRGNPKRSAFGDVTNLAKNMVGARDEAKAGRHQPAVASHNAQPLGVVNKENLVYNSSGSGSHNNYSKAKDSFLRPAQRSAALAGKPKAAAENRLAEVTRKPVPAAAQVFESQLGKGDPAVSRHTITDEIERPPPGFGAPQASTEVVALQQPRHYKSQPQLKQQPPTLRRTQSKQFEGTDAIADKAARANADAGGLSSRHLDPSAEYGNYLGHLYPGADCEPPSRVSRDSGYTDLAAKLPEISEEPQQALASRLGGQTTAMSEPEDCWDEEFDEEYDDQDQAYTTAHSFRTRDITMGGVTTLLAPRITARVQRELEEAKLEVQQTRSPEDVEEELWDVSMVAEYGEEIFEYLRELEVCFARDATLADP